MWRIKNMYDKNILSGSELLELLENAPANIFFKDTECKYRFVTEMCSSVHGGKENSIIGKTDLEIQKFPEFGKQYYEDDLKILATGKESEYVSEFPLETGSVYYEIKKKPVFQNDKIIGIIGIVNDVTKRINLEKEFEKLAYVDELTGLYNRNYLETRSRKDVHDENFPISLIMADCNLLKEVNDNLGHEYGDLLLKKIANIMKEMLPNECTPIRIGGDEFLIFCTNCNNEKAEKIISDIKCEFKEKSDDILELSVAVGYCTVYDDSISFEEALRKADLAMYEDKMITRQKRRNH